MQIFYHGPRHHPSAMACVGCRCGECGVGECAVLLTEMRWRVQRLQMMEAV